MHFIFPSGMRHHFPSLANLAEGNQNCKFNSHYKLSLSPISLIDSIAVLQKSNFRIILKSGHWNDRNVKSKKKSLLCIREKMTHYSHTILQTIFHDFVLKKYLRIKLLPLTIFSTHIGTSQDTSAGKSSQPSCNFMFSTYRIIFQRTRTIRTNVLGKHLNYQTERQ